jgi:hypothetical protein
VITVSASAHCLRCEWTAAGDWAAVDRAAEAHTRKAGHPTTTAATPVTTTDARPEPPGGSKERNTMTEPSEIRPGDRVMLRGKPRAGSRRIPDQATTDDRPVLGA